MSEAQSAPKGQMSEALSKSNREDAYFKGGNRFVYVRYYRPPPQRNFGNHSTFEHRNDVFCILSYISTYTLPFAMNNLLYFATLIVICMI